jgi:hypothetical protein
MDHPHYILDEAAKWRRCPMGMGQKIDLEHSFCLGSECMAWRWQVFDKTPDHTNALMPPPKRVYEYSTTHGYCGMVRI